MTKLKIPPSGKKSNPANKKRIHFSLNKLYLSMCEQAIFGSTKLRNLFYVLLSKTSWNLSKISMSAHD